jgi:hypothetical protein
VLRAWAALGGVAHFRGDFVSARDAWLRCATYTSESGAFLASAALACTYGGDLGRARELLDEAHATSFAGSHWSFTQYVEGELRAIDDPAASVRHYLEAITTAERVGCNFVEGVARVSLASARVRTGDVAGAASELGYLLALWRRTGQATQLWTTARNAAALLALCGRVDTAALLLLCADQVPGAAAVGPEIARFSARAFTPVSELVSDVALGALRDTLAGLGGSGVLDRATEELASLASG